MAITTVSNNSGFYDTRYWDSQTEYERRRYQEMERRRYQEMERQQQYYNPNTDTYGVVTGQQIQEGKAEKPKAPQPEYINNKTLLLLD
jgi:hypothetical protein